MQPRNPRELDLEKLRAVVLRAYTEPAFRGKLLWFPERIIAEYEMGLAEAHVLRAADLSGVDLEDDVLDKARWVFDTTEISTGE